MKNTKNFKITFEYGFLPYMIGFTIGYDYGTILMILPFCQLRIKIDKGKMVDKDGDGKLVWMSASEFQDYQFRKFREERYRKENSNYPLTAEYSI